MITIIRLNLNSNLKNISSADLMSMMGTGLGTEKDLELTQLKSDKAQEFLKLYWKNISLCAEIFQTSEQSILEGISKRSDVINKSARITGDATTHIVDFFMKHKKKFSTTELYELIEKVSKLQNLIPEKEEFLASPPNDMIKKINEIIKENRFGL